MIEHKSLQFSSVIVVCISVLFGILSSLGIPYQFYIWELFIDVKIIALILLLLFLHKKKVIQFSTIQLLVMNWSWTRNILYFFLPLFVYAISITAGLVLKEVSLTKLDNATTLVIATLFDLPAIFVFSATSILLEEIVFRGFIFSTILQKHSRMYSIILTNLLWITYSVSEIIGIEEIDALKFVAILFFFFSVGILCSVLTDTYKSIWFGYSLRVGLITLAPMIVTSVLSESDSFFTTESLLFNAEGIVVSCLLLTGSLLLFRTIQKILDAQQEKFET